MKTHCKAIWPLFCFCFCLHWPDQADCQKMIAEGILSYQFWYDSDYIKTFDVEMDSLAAELYEAGLYEHLDSAKASANRIKAKERAELDKRNVYDYTFTQAKAALLLHEKDQAPHSFTLYDFAMMTAQTNMERNGKIYGSLTKIAPEIPDMVWKDEENVVVRIDSSDVKTIAGFRCLKYYFQHTHRMVKNNALVEQNIEMYVTTEIQLPWWVLLPMCRKAQFKGCPLEFRFVTTPPSKMTFRAFSFSPNVDMAKLEVPGHLRK